MAVAEALLVGVIVLAATLRAGWILAGARLQRRWLEWALPRVGQGRLAAALRRRLEELRQPSGACGTCRGGGSGAGSGAGSGGPR